MERLCARVADRLIAVGNVQGEQVRAALWLRRGSVPAVWNGVHFSERGADPSFRGRYAEADTVLIGTLANLIDQKGLPDLLKVARRLKDAHANVRFVIAGEGKLRPELERLRRDLGLEQTVIFAGWMTNAAASLLPAVDIYFQPSLWEAMSIALLEAMAAGKPIVSTSVGEAPYVIADGEDGLLVEPRDIEAMVRQLDRLITDPGLRHRLGEAAERKATEQFTVARMARAYEAVYLEALGLQ
jgi:glycosyltransferase involved in cell wall biosynthesis